MSLPPTICDLELLRLSLDERLDEQREEHLAQHLAGCQACQRELERLAGERNDWSQVSVALQAEAELKASGGRTNSRRDSETVAATSHSADEPADDMLADFAVDFLNASTAPDAIGRIGEIDILEVIGRGGMGDVLKG